MMIYDGILFYTELGLTILFGLCERTQQNSTYWSGPLSGGFLKAVACSRGLLRKPLSERILDVVHADLGPVGEDADHVEAQGIELGFSGVEVVFGYGAQGILLAVGDGFQWVSEAGPASQLDLHENEGVILAHYQVDLPAPGPVVALDERVTVLDQVPQGEVFAPGPWGFVVQSPTPA